MLARNCDSLRLAQIMRAYFKDAYADNRVRISWKFQNRSQLMTRHYRDCGSEVVLG